MITNFAFCVLGVSVPLLLACLCVCLFDGGGGVVRRVLGRQIYIVSCGQSMSSVESQKSAININRLRWEPEGHYAVQIKSMHGESALLVLNGTSLNIESGAPFWLSSDDVLRNTTFIIDNEKIIRAFVTSRLDCCNSLFFGLPDSRANYKEYKTLVLD